MLGYDYAELKDFPRSSPSPTLTASSSSTASLSPMLSPISSSFKEVVPAFQLNTNSSSDSLYQHFYNQKKSTHNQPTTAISPILLTSWSHNNKIAF